MTVPSPNPCTGFKLYSIKMRPTATVLTRSAWKVPFVVPLPLKEAKAQNMPVRTKARACMIVPSFVGVTFQVHTGNAYKQFKISEEMVGYKLGDFAPTKVRSIHKKK